MAGIINLAQYFKTDPLKQDLNELKISMDALESKLVGIIEQSKKTNQAMQAQTATQSQANKAINDTNKNLDVLAQAEIEQNKLKEQQIKIVAKARAERSEENKTLVKAKLARQEQNKKIQNAIKLEKTEEGSLARLKDQNAALIKQRDKLNPTLDANKKKISDLNAIINKNNQVIKSNSSTVEQQKQNVGNYRSALEGIPGPLGNATSGIGRMSSAFKVLLANPVVLIIAGIVGVITGLVKALKRSEEGTNRLNKIMAGLKAGLAVILDIFTNLAVKMVDAFKNPQQAIKDLWEAIKTNLVNKVKGLADLFVGLKDISVGTFKLIGAAVKNAFTDNQAAVDQYKEDIKNATKDIAKATFQTFTGVEAEKALDFFKDIVEEINNESRAAANLEARRQALVKQERAFIVEREKLNAQIAKARELAQDENVPIEERRKLIEEAIAANERLFSKEVEFANERAAIVAAEVALGESSADELTKVEELRAEAFRAEISRSEGRKSLLRDQRRVENEYEKSRRDEQKITLEQELLNEKKKLLNFQGTQEDKAKAYEDFAVKVLEIQINLSIQELENVELTAEERLRIESDLIDKQIELEKKKTENTEEEGKKRFDLESENAQAIIGIANSTFDTISMFRDNEIANLENQKAYELELAGDNTAKKEEIERTYAAKEKEIKKKQANTDKLQGIFNASINTAIAITKALAMEGPLGIPVSIALGILGAAQITAIATRPIPEFAEGVDSLPQDTAAIYGEAGREIINEPGKPAYIADRPTLGYLKKGTHIIPNYETEKILAGSGGMTERQFEKLVKATEKRPQIINNSTIVTEKGFRHQTKVGNTEIKWINKYLHR